MMKKFLFLIPILLSTSLFAVVESNDERALGEKLFKMKNCTMCHKKEIESTGPSIISISSMYSGKEKKLYKYLKGFSKPIVNPSKAHIMDAQFIKLKSFDEKKIKAITRYIITISDREMI